MCNDCNKRRASPILLLLGGARQSSKRPQVISQTVCFHTWICLQPEIRYDKGQENKQFNLLIMIKSRHSLFSYRQLTPSGYSITSIQIHFECMLYMKTGYPQACKSPTQDTEGETHPCGCFLKLWAYAQAFRERKKITCRIPPFFSVLHSSRNVCWPKEETTSNI